MATKKRAEWIADINKLEEENPGILGEVTQEELDNCNVGQLKSLFKEMDDELKAKDQPEEKSEKEEGFVSMCGDNFNPKKNGSCYKQCQKDFPDAFAACEKNYAESDVAKKAAKKPTLGKTPWGHINGKQGGLVDTFFYEGQIGTIDEVAAFAGGKAPRCLAHMKHLVADVGVVILMKDRTVEQEDGKKLKVKEYWWQEKDKRRKGEPLEGKGVPGWNK